MSVIRRYLINVIALHTLVPIHFSVDVNELFLLDPLGRFEIVVYG